MVTKITSIRSSETSVLIVDDSRQYSEVLRRMLVGGFGYSDITLAESTEQALNLIKSEPEKFRLVFVDYNFPDGQSGGDLLRKLTENALMEERIAFLITSEPTVDNMKEALSAGALGVVAKPFDRAELRSKIEKAELLIRTNNNESF